MKKSPTIKSFTKKLDEIEVLLDDSRISKVFRLMLLGEKKELLEELVKREEHELEQKDVLFDLAKRLDPECEEVFECKMNGEYYWAGAWMMRFEEPIYGLIGWSFLEAKENLESGFIEYI